MDEAQGKPGTGNPRQSPISLLGGSYSYAYGINASGQIVGYSTLAGDVTSDAFLYSGGILYDLNSLISPTAGWTLQSANAINDSGEIVGYGLNPSGQADAFLLTLVPEPSSLAVVGLAFLALLARRVR